jgi:hypothetical protein
VAKRTRWEYVQLGRGAILSLLDEHLAATSMELEARISDERWHSLDTKIDPHHVTDARRQLLNEGAIASESAETRGGRRVTVWQAVGGRRTTAISRASQRKRILQARYLGWAEGTPSQKGLIGPAGEAATHASLIRAGSFQLARPEGGTVAKFLGVDVPIGPLDNGLYFSPLLQGIPQAAIAVPIEVKNVRDQIYPVSKELYQLLAKAQRLQQLRPDMPIAPVLVCRRAHYTTFKMALALGFFVVEARRQYIGGVDQDKLLEVRNGLGFYDLDLHDGEDVRLVHLFRDVFPGHATGQAQQWVVTADDPYIADSFQTMRKDMPSTTRVAHLGKLRDRCRNAGLGDGW